MDTKRRLKKVEAAIGKTERQAVIFWIEGQDGAPDDFGGVKMTRDEARRKVAELPEGVTLFHIVRQAG